MALGYERVIKFVRHPRLKQVELRFSHYRRRAFDKHMHDTYSVGVVNQGRTHIFHQQLDETIGAGEVVLINPGEVHACNPRPGAGLTYYMLYLEPAFMQKIASAVSGQDKVPYFIQPVVRDRHSYNALLEVCGAIFEGDSEFEIEANLEQVMSWLVQNFTDTTGQPDPLSGTIEFARKGREYLLDNLSRNVSLQEVSAQTGLSPYHFLRVFRHHYGLPPHSYQLQQRINLARHMLADGQPIVQVATEVGFADQSHFTRKFKAFVGTTPRQYQL